MRAPLYPSAASFVAVRVCQARLECRSTESPWNVAGMNAALWSTKRWSEDTLYHVAKPGQGTLQSYWKVELHALHVVHE